MESFLKSFERREEKNLLSGGGRFLSKEERKMNQITINRSKKRMENNSWKSFEGREEKNSLPEGGRFLFEERRKMNRL